MLLAKQAQVKGRQAIERWLLDAHRFESRQRFQEAAEAIVDAAREGNQAPEWAANLVVAFQKEHEVAMEVLATEVALRASEQQAALRAVQTAIRRR